MRSEFLSYNSASVALRYSICRTKTSDKEMLSYGLMKMKKKNQAPENAVTIHQTYIFYLKLNTSLGTSLVRNSPSQKEPLSFRIKKTLKST